jgi:WD40 repeat protein
MKRRRFFKFAFLLIIPLALYAYVYRRNAIRLRVISMRPVVVGLPGINPIQLSFSPDGRYLLVIHQYLSGGDEPTPDLIVYEVASRKRVGTLKRHCWPDFLDDGKRIVSGGQYTIQKSIFLFPSLRFVKKVPVPPSTSGGNAGWPKPEILAMSDTKGSISLWNTHNGAMRKVSLPLRPLRKGYCYEAEFLPDKKTVVFGEFPEYGALTKTDLQFWDLVTKSRRFVLKNSMSLSQGHLASRNGIWAAWNAGDKVDIWNYYTGKKMRTIRGGFFQLALSPDGTSLAAICPLSTITLWDTKNGRINRKLRHDGSNFRSLIFSPDSRTIAGGDWKGSAYFWRVK